MSTPQWSPATLYEKGALVVPRAQIQPPGAPIENAGFEQGDVAWTKGQGWAINQQNGFRGSWVAMLVGEGLGRIMVSDTRAAIRPGTQFRASCYVQPTRSNDSASLLVRFYDEIGIQIPGDKQGNLVKGTGGWRVSSGNFVAPARAAFVSLGVIASKYTNSFLGADEFSWSYVGVAPIAGLMFRAVQPNMGLSAAEEPQWPGQLGLTVVDNEVIWEAVLISRVVWRAEPILVSGDTEPQWPDGVGDRVADGTISWEAQSRSISDPNCPHSRYIRIIDGKVYAGDGDIVAFSAVNAPWDWSSPNDAGFLPFGLGEYGSNPIRVLGIYRGNLIVMNGDGFQLWQVDPDPAANNKIDALPVGSVHHRCFAKVGNDALLLTAKGVRSVGITATSNSIQTMDVGTPVDSVVQAAVAASDRTLAFFTPAGGQYWLVTNRGSESEVFVYSVSQVGKIGAWSRYLYPFRIDAHAFEEETLLLRSGNQIIEPDPSVYEDLVDSSMPVPVVGWFETHMLDGGSFGSDKTLEGIDLVSADFAGTVAAVQIGWNQRDRSKMTPPVRLPLDTAPDYMVPIEVTAPSVFVRVEYTGGKWRFDAMNLYLQDRRLAR